MSDTTPDGTSQPSDEELRRTEELGDGSRTGDATEDPDQDSDVDSGGEPAEPRETPGVSRCG